MTSPPLLLPFLLFLTATSFPLDPTTVPSSTNATTTPSTSACQLDLSDELFGGVSDACSHPSLDRGRCCPVLAAWLFAAHARSALNSTPSSSDGPLIPDDNQRCVQSLQSALDRRRISLPRPNSTCDAVLCFCAIRLHQIGSLRCPAAFTVAPHGVSFNVTPTPAVRQLERDCRNASFAGCSRCLRSLDKLKGHGVSGANGSSSSVARTNMMFGRDCELMGLTWLLEKNKTAYIPAVSAVLRAILYSGEGESRCSLDEENMPLAVDSLQFHQHYQSSASSFSFSCGIAFWCVAIISWFACVVICW